MKRLFSILTLLLALLILSACTGGGTETDAPAGGNDAGDDSSAEGEPAFVEMTAVELSLAFRPDVQFAPFYVAMDRGFFAAHGLNVTITHRSESDAAKLVATDEGDGPFQVAVISGEQHLLARAAGLPVVYVYEWFQQYPVGIAALSESGIDSPDDLAGRTVGVPMLEGASYIGMRALLDAGGLTESDITLEATGFTQAETLATGGAEAVVIYINNEPIQLNARGESVNVIPVSDYADLVSNGLIVSEARVGGSPAVVRALAAAFNDALAYTLQNPDEAFTISANFVEGLTDLEIEPIAREVLYASLPLWSASRLGESTLPSWELTQDVLINVGLLEAPLDLSAAYTNDFLP